ncbi:uncharacterized protein RHO25_011408 [Cercospora beticola]|uniref:Uncharacterized protein n=1 Tax=Cercospora beticola TaxID=122368 RepID=A0ABZ0P4M5_CERBT|nr:hypothetical protein RHO25_011408 [Cercospora beticola]
MNKSERRIVLHARKTRRLTKSAAVPIVPAHSRRKRSVLQRRHDKKKCSAPVKQRTELVLRHVSTLSASNSARRRKKLEYWPKSVPTKNESDSGRLSDLRRRRPIVKQLPQLRLLSSRGSDWLAKKQNVDRRRSSEKPASARRLCDGSNMSSPKRPDAKTSRDGNGTQRDMPGNTSNPLAMGPPVTTKRILVVDEPTSLTASSPLAGLLLLLVLPLRLVLAP